NLAASSSPRQFVEAGGIVFFTADDGVNGIELWRTDGTPAGTMLVKDIDPLASSRPSSLVDFNGTLFFAASYFSAGQKLFQSDGTAAGTVPVKDVNVPGRTDAAISAITVVGSALFFVVNRIDTRAELWMSD